MATSQSLKPPARPAGRTRLSTEKPVSLLAQLIEQSSLPGELMLDPFCGSGNTGKAARRLNRRALMCDVDAEAADRRLRLAATCPDGPKS